MSDPIEPLLEPISAEHPCGVDLSYDPVQNDLAVLMEGTPENQYETGSAKEPNWALIRKLSEESLKKSKDLQLGIYFTVALTQTAGMAGTARGVELLAGIVRKYWDGLFPALDPDDKDPTQRVNILTQLTVERGSFGDTVKFIERLSAAAIFKAPGQVVNINYFTGEAGADKLPELLAAADPAESAAGVAALRRVAAAVHSIDDYLVQTLGRGVAPSFDPLIKVIDRGLRVIDGTAPALPAGGEAATAGQDAAPGAAASGAKAAISGEIRSDDDVRKMLGKIRAYYAANEPASPVPLLLERAERLVGRDFLDLLNNLAPAARPALEVLMGPTAAQEEAARQAANKK